ncbi:hypothetical protein RJ641_026148 [Dillenia turbinata]|uniref:Expansin-like EG45 domain-containing protein n=1 Tax=Dillenia turbinata TaxID=194707 RepID=A0AAN8ZP73_9MAGN
MSNTLPLVRGLVLLFLIIVAGLSFRSHGDVGTATQYDPPYLPTECYGNDGSQFPPNNFFAAAGDGIWDNGAACGRQYLVRCISAATRDACVQDTTIQVKIVDYDSTAIGSTMILSGSAFSAITTSSADPSVNIEFQQ